MRKSGQTSWFTYCYILAVWICSSVGREAGYLVKRVYCTYCYNLAVWICARVGRQAGCRESVRAQVAHLDCSKDAGQGSNPTFLSSSEQPQGHCAVCDIVKLKKDRGTSCLYEAYTLYNTLQLNFCYKIMFHLYLHLVECHSITNLIVICVSHLTLTIICNTWHFHFHTVYFNCNFG